MPYYIPRTGIIMNSDRHVDAINSLISNCQDGVNGYEIAARNIHNEALKALFEDYAQQRLAFGRQLLNLVIGEGKASGDTSLKNGNRWAHIKVAVTGGDTKSILAECERSEDSALNVYEEALETGLPESVEEVVLAQYKDLLAVYDMICILRDSYE